MPVLAELRTRRALRGCHGARRGRLHQHRARRAAPQTTRPVIAAGRGIGPRGASPGTGPRRARLRPHEALQDSPRLQAARRRPSTTPSKVSPTSTTSPSLHDLHTPTAQFKLPDQDLLRRASAPFCPHEDLEDPALWPTRGRRRTPRHERHRLPAQPRRIGDRAKRRSTPPHRRLRAGLPPIDIEVAVDDEASGVTVAAVPGQSTALRVAWQQDPRRRHRGLPSDGMPSRPPCVRLCVRSSASSNCGSTTALSERRRLPCGRLGCLFLEVNRPLMRLRLARRCETLFAIDGSCLGVGSSRSPWI